MILPRNINPRVDAGGSAVGEDVRVVGVQNVVAAVAGEGVEEGAGGGGEEGAAEGEEEGGGHLGTKLTKRTKLTATWNNFNNKQPERLTWTTYTKDLIE